MARTALLIGAQTHGLTGVHNDVAVMADALRLWDFACTTLTADDASRAGILEAYKELIADAQPNDAIFVYYSGHGGFYRQPGYASMKRPMAAMQFIVPTDYAESVEGDFRGITSIELSQLHGELTDKTKNVTVALDCCHASHMSRDRGLRVRSLDRSAGYPVVMAHLEKLQRRGHALDRWRPEGSADVVRMVACAPEQSAYEYNNDVGRRNGMFTDALARVLSEAVTTTITWATVIDRVREEVLRLMPTQRPEAEGPARRVLFDLAQADPVAAFPVVDLGRRKVRLDGGPLLGINVGDEFAVMPPDSPGPDSATKIGDVRVDRLDSVAAFGILELRPEHATLPLGAQAHRVKAAASPLAVRLPGDDPRAADLIRAMDREALVRPAKPEEKTHYAVKIDEGGGLSVCDQVGPLHAQPRPPGRAGIVRVMNDLRRLARASALRAAAAHSVDTPGLATTVEFGLVQDGAERPLRHTGEILYVQQQIYVRVSNDGTDTVHVCLLDIGVAAKISLLNASSPSGLRLDPGKEYVFGLNQLTGRLAGIPLDWPEGLPGEQPRLNTILAVITSEPQDMRVFETEGVLRSHGPRSGLQQVFDQIATGSTRDVSRTAGRGVRCALHTIDFDLMPVPAPHLESVHFEVDERPDKSVLLYSPRGNEPMTVAVRLSDLIVHHNRAFRSADIRLDTVVLTGAKPDFQAHTERFQNIRDGEPLPLDKMLVYSGPAVDYLDIAVWVTRESRDSLALNDLLRERLPGTEWQGGPQAAVAAVGASAVVINTAYRLLRDVVGDSIGLYRTTLLGHEQFGTDRRADQNLVRAQDFSFTYAVESVAERRTPSIASAETAGKHPPPRKETQQHGPQTNHHRAV